MIVKDCYIVKEKVFSKDDFLKKAVRYRCDICGAIHTSLEIYDENDVVLCPVCASKAGCDDENMRPAAPEYLNLNNVFAPIELLF